MSVASVSCGKAVRNAFTVVLKSSVVYNLCMRASTVLSPLCTGKCTNLNIFSLLNASIRLFRKDLTVLGVIMPTRILKSPSTLATVFSNVARFVPASFP